MRPCIEAKDITREIRGQLPVIDEYKFSQRFCQHCPYYAGRINHVARCILKKCSWDTDEENFSPVLKKMIPILESEFKQASEKYKEAKRKNDLIKQMFARELEAQRRKKDPCATCSYRTHAPCLGFCYLQMTSNPSDNKTGRRKQDERNYNHGTINQRSKLQRSPG